MNPERRQVFGDKQRREISKQIQWKKEEAESNMRMEPRQIGGAGFPERGSGDNANLAVTSHSIFTFNI